MTAMRMVGDGPTKPRHATAVTTQSGCLIELDVSVCVERSSLERTPRRAVATHSAPAARKPLLVHPEATPC